MWVLSFSIALSAWLIFLARNSPKIDPDVDLAKSLRNFVAHNFSVSQPINVRFGNRGFKFPDLVPAAQKQLDFRLKQDGVPYKFPLIDHLPENIERPSTVQNTLAEAVLTDSEYVANASSSVSTTSDQVSLSSLNIIKLNDSSALKMFDTIPEYSVELYYLNQPRLSLDLVQLKAYLAYHLEFIHENDLPFYLTQSVYDTLLRPDLELRKEMLLGKRKFSDIIRHLNVNIVAAEELGVTPEDITKAVSQHMRRFEAIQSFANISVSVQTLNVSKRKPAANLLRNTSAELTFFYLTTMRPYADSLYGVPLRHLDPLENEAPIQGDQYGTEYQQQLLKSQTVIYNVTSFVEEMSDCIKRVLLIPESGSPNTKLMVEAMMKQYTILGLVEGLDFLIAQEQFDSDSFNKICVMVDTILTEEQHDWASHLTKVSELLDEIKR